MDKTKQDMTGIKTAPVDTTRLKTIPLGTLHGTPVMWTGSTGPSQRRAGVLESAAGRRA